MMLKKLLSCLLLSMLVVSSLSGCYQMGRAGGKTTEAVEEGAQDTKQGYEDAREEK